MAIMLRKEKHHIGNNCTSSPASMSTFTSDIQATQTTSALQQQPRQPRHVEYALQPKPPPHIRYFPPHTTVPCKSRSWLYTWLTLDTTSDLCKTSCGSLDSQLVQVHTEQCIAKPMVDQAPEHEPTVDLQHWPAFVSVGRTSSVRHQGPQVAACNTCFRAPSPCVKHTVILSWQ